LLSIQVKSGHVGGAHPVPPELSDNPGYWS
jgi:hypothetical protein